MVASHGLASKYAPGKQTVRPLLQALTMFDFSTFMQTFQYGLMVYCKQKKSLMMPTVKSSVNSVSKCLCIRARALLG